MESETGAVNFSWSVTIEAVSFLRVHQLSLWTEAPLMLRHGLLEDTGSLSLTSLLKIVFRSHSFNVTAALTFALRGEKWTRTLLEPQIF